MIVPFVVFFLSHAIRKKEKTKKKKKDATRALFFSAFMPLTKEFVISIQMSSSVVSSVDVQTG